MKTPVQRVVVLPLATRAHLEFTHRCLGTIVGNILNDGKSGPAVSAVGKSVTKAAVGGGKNLFFTVGAGGDIGRNQLVVPLAAQALPNPEIAIAPGGGKADFDIFDARHGRGFGLKVFQETVKPGLVPLHLDLHIPRGIAHPAFKVVLLG
ncbi:hypothetical protein ES703_102291 [subsurface metagenome]